MLKVKICGITNLDDAQAAVHAGCDAIGFLFYKKSPRYISPEQAKDIIDKLPKNVIKIGVFVNAKEEIIKRIARICKFRMLQFHGSESPEFCARFKGYRIIKTFRVKGKLDVKDMARYHPFAFLFDTYIANKSGGTGKKFNWKLIRHIDGLKRPVFLAGGLTEKNVRTAVKITEPAWVDVCSGVEEKPGKKDHKKVKEFIKAAKVV
ncbi:MAG: phosphoribosylanthranilate isomerase [Candidatus Omnitrophota bacterium]